MLKVKRRRRPRRNLKLKPDVDTVWPPILRQGLWRSTSWVNTGHSMLREVTQRITLPERGRHWQMTLNGKRRLCKSSKKLSIIKTKTKTARQYKWSVQKSLNILRLRRKSKSLLKVTRMLIVKMTLNSRLNLLYCVIFFTAPVISNILAPKKLG